MKSTSTRIPLIRDLPEWVTPEEARTVLRFGRTKIYEELKANNLPSVRFGRLIRIPRGALEQLLAK